MKNTIKLLLCFLAISCMSVTCKKQGSANNNPVPPQNDTSLVNTQHLEYLTVPVTFSDGVNAFAVYIYADAPDYKLTPAAGEGYACVDDVARAALVYLRSPNFKTDTAIQSKAERLIHFVLEMQSPNGYFYNFLSSGADINRFGQTSINNPEWWSWRALQTLTEGAPLLQSINSGLSKKMNDAVDRLVTTIKKDLVPLSKDTISVKGIRIPTWLPAGSGTDQAALLIMGLIPYCERTNDEAIKDYIEKLGDGIVLMQKGDDKMFPYGAFLSWQNTWHAYGNEQAYALLKAAEYLQNERFKTSALMEIDNFYPWLVQNGYLSSFVISDDGNEIKTESKSAYDQIAYGIKPMIFAASEAFRQTGDKKYADLAGHIAAWFFGANVAGQIMYSTTTGRCFDGLSSSGVNKNSGAESTIEALLTMQKVEESAEIEKSMKSYSK